MTKSNMYNWVNKTWNPVNGACPHACSYCYVQHSRVKKLYEGEIRLNNNATKKSLGKGNFIFVGSCFDIFANGVPKEWIWGIIIRCLGNPTNQYLFQTKNPKRFLEFKEYLNNHNEIIFGTTIETNRNYRHAFSREISLAPEKQKRAEAMSKLSARKMVSIEPIMNFDLSEMVELVKMCNPEFVSIGADSKGHNLPEPPAGKITALISELKKFTEVREKDNLRRLLK